ncbi:hypothetical protein RhiirC2_762597, partial [Rhizophagus irregularis]
TSNLSPVVLFTDGDPAMIAASKLHGEMINNFIGDFHHMRNNYTQCQFESRYKEMLTKYEPYRTYLKKKLYPSRES